MKEQILKLAREHGLERVSERIERAILPGIHLTKVSAAELPVGSSRIGGLPDVPPDFQWPQWRDRPLGFLAQIQCDELPRIESDLLPSSEMLYFFYDLVDQPWGYDPEDRGGAVVIFAENPASLSTASLPSGAKRDDVSLPAFGVKFSIIPTLPSMNTTALEQLRLTDEESYRYVDFYLAVQRQFIPKEPEHQLLGHSHNIQGDMQLKCQLVSNGIWCGDRRGYENPQSYALAPGAAEWRLLFQFDSDDGLGVMWGDAGRIYFWIRESDIRDRSLDQTWTVLQCG
jgi:uncharacterized protein YwqG